ncbi:GNAT family N-acetyltransferase [Paracoccus sp. M683]|uniref:GNAT family N-acetyltransferase n=1 Tax=Paracoccus sp. M683 TaxID=2594268 RepID=UPI00117D7CC2|nr:GNAT family N-acetyltransferase [Paracoccus sp. M683]TRW97706.1 GNAT family N-acetyltransferase [Paracoccus sp. M683]
MQQDTFPLTTDFGTIRCARPADSARIVQMIGQLALHHGDSPTLTVADLQRDLFAETPWIHVLVAETQDRLIGYAAMCGLIQLHFGLRGMDLHHLFTDRAHRGGGVGRSLVDACKIKAAALSCRYLTVGTHPDNHRAQAFYESLGFMRRDAHPPRFSIRLDPEFPATA